MDNQPSLCFIIACKVYKNYPCYLEFYVLNIKKYYPSALIILVDNNSTYKEYYDIFKDTSVLVLENTSTSKFEVGAYKFATEYIKNNNIKVDYYICTQDTFVLVNKYDFNTLIKDNVKACTLSHFNFYKGDTQHREVLTKLNMYDPTEEFLCCWCASWCCDHDTLLKINDMLYSIIPTSREDSIQTERYMGKILKLLNNNISYSIEEKGIEGHNYNCHTVEITSGEVKELGSYFVKRAQRKTETTPE